MVTTLSILRRRKTRYALLIKIFLLISVTLYYALLHSVDSNVDSATISIRSSSSVHRGRKLLATEENVIANSSDNLLAASTNDTSQPEQNCTAPAILDFPSDGFTRVQRQQGWVVVHILVACYCFWLLAIVCDDYFVPVLDSLCTSLQISDDIAGCTIMAAATSSPELFINCVGTFITEGDIGVGTIVGSAVFNILAVPACCGLFAGQTVYLDWWPVTRDSMMYGVSVVALILTLYDGIIMWYEGLGLVLAYFFYLAVIYCNDTMAKRARLIVAKCRRKYKPRPYKQVTEITPLFSKGSTASVTNGATANGDRNGHVANGNVHGNGVVHKSNSDVSLESNESELDCASTPWAKGDDGYICYICKWPIVLLLWLTIPDCRRYPKLRILTFIMCIVWIGLTSYIVSFTITTVGDTFKIVDSVTGLTFLAMGMSLPEAVSSVIVTNQGHGAMGISNSIGSNTFDILLCLGLPWLIKAAAFPAVPGVFSIPLNSSGLTYSAFTLLSTLFGLYIAFACNRFKLDWKVGLTCTLMYGAFLVFASLVELNYFFPVNLPVCEH